MVNSKEAAVTILTLHSDSVVVTDRGIELRGVGYPTDVQDDEDSCTLDTLEGSVLNCTSHCADEPSEECACGALE